MDHISQQSEEIRGMFVCKNIKPETILLFWGGSFSPKQPPGHVTVLVYDILTYRKQFDMLTDKITSTSDLLLDSISGRTTFLKVN